MSKSPLLALPAELRLQIYSHVFTTHTQAGAEDGIVSEDTDAGTKPGLPACEILVETSRIITIRRIDGAAHGTQANLSALLRTCKQIHAEAADILYEQTLFRIALCDAGAEIVDQSTGRLKLRAAWACTDGWDIEDGRPLRDLSLFDKMQSVHLDLNIGRQASPIWDALAVTRGIVATLNPRHKHTSACLRFGLMAAVTCVRLPDEPWARFVGKLKEIDLGCAPDVEVDEVVERWTKYGRHKFEAVAGTMGGSMRFAKFKERVGPHDQDLRACVIL